MLKTVKIRQLCGHSGFAFVLFALVIAMMAPGMAGATGVDTTTFDLDRDGADVVPTAQAQPAGIDEGNGPDITTLYLDRWGADIPEGNWWGKSGVEDRAQVAAVEPRISINIADLNLDRDGADVVG